MQPCRVSGEGFGNIRKYAKKLKIIIQKPATHKKVELSKDQLIEEIMHNSPVAAEVMGGRLELGKKNLKPLQNIAGQMKIKTSKDITQKVKDELIGKAKGHLQVLSERGCMTRNN